MLSGMFSVWTKNFVNFFLVYLVLALVNLAISSAFSFAIFGSIAPPGGLVPGTPPRGILSADIGRVILYAVLVFQTSLIVGAVVVGGMTEYSVRRFRGEAFTLEQALSRGMQRFSSILGAEILIGGVIFVLVFAPILLILPVLYTGLMPAAALLALCGLFLAIVLGGALAIFVYVSLSLFAPAIMMENAKAMDGLVSSWTMTKGHRWALFGAILIVGVLTGVVSSVIVVPVLFAGNPILSVAGTVLTSAILGPWLVILVGVSYDLILRAPRLLYGAQSSYPPTPQISPPPGAGKAPPSPPAP